MADSASRTQRAAALEEKRRRLDDLKKRRENRGVDTAKVKASASANLDEYIDGLLSQPSSETAVEAKTTNEKTNTVVETTKEEDTNDDGKSNQSVKSNVIAEVAPPPLPKYVETFTVSTQTEDFEFSDNDDLEQGEDEGTEAKLPSKKVADDEGNKEEEKDPRVLSSKEVEKEIAIQPFSSFINTASKKVERMLGTPLLFDLLSDYVGETDNEKRAESKDTNADKFLSSRQVYECLKWTGGRDVTDIDWSLLHRELILSTYHVPMSAGSSVPLQKGSAAVSALSPRDTLSSSLTPRSGELQSDGLALIWSLAMPTRPEHIFTCGSPVTSGRFHPSETTLIIGGCESGQLVVWDIRAGRLPVQKSALATVAGSASKGHTHPIGSMEIIEGGSGMVTASTDGRVNFWSLANLRDPAESILVGDSVSCFAVAPESETILLGDEYGRMYTVQSSSQTSGQRSSRRQAKKLATSDEKSGDDHGHYGMITCLSTKALKKGASTRAAGLYKGFLRGSGGLVLSSGVDWTVKLWAPAYSDKPLTSLVSHSYDYMSSVMWSPSHPSVFATASSNGTVGLWNLATSFEEPMTGQDGIVVEPDAMSGRGLNKLKWSSDGRRIAVAASDRLHILSLTEEVTRSKGDEDSKIMNQLLARGLIERQ